MEIAEEAVEMAAVEEEEEEVYAWSWGAGTDGQLGTGTLEDQHLPQVLPHLPTAVSSVACGGAHAVALTGTNSPESTNPE
ncbi:hypothetical protein BHM03_00012241 [Ensete ventricosum]|nr:hypothetical protein BHM03_00012241 [Ensete ventricosum]